MSKVYLVKNRETGELEAYASKRNAYRVNGWNDYGMLELELKRNKRIPPTYTWTTPVVSVTAIVDDEKEAEAKVS